LNSQNYYPIKKVINGDTVVLISQKQANDLNEKFKVYKSLNEKKLQRIDSLFVIVDSLKRENLDANKVKISYYKTLIKQEQEILRLEQKTNEYLFASKVLDRSERSLGLSTISVMFSFVLVTSFFFIRRL